MATVDVVSKSLPVDLEPGDLTTALSLHSSNKHGELSQLLRHNGSITVTVTHKKMLNCNAAFRRNCLSICCY